VLRGDEREEVIAVGDQVIVKKVPLQMKECAWSCRRGDQGEVLAVYKSGLLQYDVKFHNQKGNFFVWSFAKTEITKKMANGGYDCNGDLYHFLILTLISFSLF